MSDLRSDEARRISEHHPTLMTARRSAWATCRCGWRSMLLNVTRGRGAAAAAQVWADHVAEVAL